MDLFAVNCPTCRARLQVREAAAIGQIVNCPKCGSMLEVRPPAGWTMPKWADEVQSQRAEIHNISAQTTVVSAAPAFHWSAEASASKPPEPALAQPAGPQPAAPRAAAAEPADEPAPIGQHEYVDPTSVRLQLESAAKSEPEPNAEPDPREPSTTIARECLAAWGPWASVPLAGILSAWIVGYVLRSEPKTATSPEASPAASAAVAPAQAPGAPEPFQSPTAMPAPESTPTTFVHTAAAATPATAAPAPTPPAAAPREARVVMRPVSPPSDLEIAARTPSAAAAAPSPVPDKLRLPLAALPAAVPPVAPLHKPKPALAASSASLKSFDVNKALSTRIESLEMPGISLLGFVQLIGGMAGVPLTLDVDACRELGVPLDRAFEVHEHDLTLRELLAHVLAPHGLIVESSPAGLLITSAASHRHQLEQVSYSVADLNDTPAALAGMIEALVEPERWLERGGAGRIDIDGPQLVVSQTPRVHYQVAVLLEKLRLLRGKPANVRVDPLDASLESPYRRLAAKLTTTVSANYRQPADLPAIATELARSAGTRVLFDWQSLAAAGYGPGAQVAVVVDKQPLATALDQLLSPLELSYRVAAADVIEIASIATLRARPELDAYAAQNLVDSAAPAAAASEAIGRWFASRLPEIAWGPTTGWRLDRQSRYLLVRQDAASQRTIEAAIQSADAVPAEDAGRQAASPGSGEP